MNEMRGAITVDYYLCDFLRNTQSFITIKMYKKYTFWFKNPLQSILQMFKVSNNIINETKQTNKKSGGRGKKLSDVLQGCMV